MRTNCRPRLVRPAVVDQEMDSELQNVFIDVVSLPMMVTPVCDMDGTLRMPQAECPVIAHPAVPAFVNRPSQTLSSSGPKRVSPIVFSPPPVSVGVPLVLRTSPLVTVPEDFMLFNKPESSQSLMGSMSGGRLPAIPLTPSQATVSRPTMKLGVVGESSEVTDRLREGPFDITAGQPGVSVSNDFV